MMGITTASIMAREAMVKLPNRRKKLSENSVRVAQENPPHCLGHRENLLQRTLLLILCKLCLQQVSGGKFINS